MQVAISLFLASFRKNHRKCELVEKNIHRKPLFEINYTMFLAIHTNNYASLTIGIRSFRKNHRKCELVEKNIIESLFLKSILQCFYQFIRTKWAFALFGQIN